MGVGQQKGVEGLGAPLDNIPGPGYDLGWQDYSLKWHEDDGGAMHYDDLARAMIDESVPPTLRGGRQTFSPFIMPQQKNR